VTDLVLPIALRQARSTLRYIDSTGVTRGVYTGVPQTTNYGGDRIGATIDFTPLGGNQASEKSLRAQLQAFYMGLRGKTNRVYLTDSSYVRRGSFPASELFLNADFNVATGWTASTGVAGAVSDGVMRLTADGTFSGQPRLSQSIAYAASIPYVVRSLIRAGSGYAGETAGPRLDDTGSIIYSNVSLTRGYLVAAGVPHTAGVGHAAYISNGALFGSYLDVLFASASRCMLADAPNNLLTQSSGFDQTDWTKTGATVTANAVSAPDGTASADALVETGAATHTVSQTLTVPAAAADFAIVVDVRASARNFVELVIRENSGSTSIAQFFNLGTKAVGTNGGTGGNWSGRRSFVTDLGNSWLRCVLIGRKTNAATGITVSIMAGSADGTDTYVGASTALHLANATLSSSSVAMREVSTTTTAISTATLSGLAIPVKGLPVSTVGLLLVGDWVEIDGQMKMVTASLDSDSAGLGYLQFSPPLRRAISDNTPVIVHRPMGRFMLASDDSGWANEPGVFSTAAIELEEAFG
jgi:hypothetical protein